MQHFLAGYVKFASEKASMDMQTFTLETLLQRYAVGLLFFRQTGLADVV